MKRFRVSSKLGNTASLMPKIPRTLNIGVLCNLFTLVEGTESMMKTHDFKDDKEYIQKCRDITSQSRSLIDRLMKLLQEKALQFKIEIGMEVLYLREVEGKPSSLRYLSIGTNADEARNSEFIRFILETLEQNMGLNCPSLVFFMFYLPPQPSAISSEGFSMETVGGFTNVKKGNRIELNIYPNRDLEVMFQNVTHEIIHCVVLSDPDLKHSEALVESLTSDFFSVHLPLTNYHKRRLSVLQSLDDIIRKKFEVLREFDNWIGKQLNEELKVSKKNVEALQQFWEAIRSEKVVLLPK